MALKYKLSMLALVCSSIAQANTMIIDGQLNEAQWQNAQVINNFVTTKPYSLTTPEYQTEVRVLSNEQGIYIGIKNQQPKATQISTRTSKDDYLDADYNNIIVDFDNNGIGAYQFTIGNGGSMMDGTYRDENKFSKEWDGVWYAKTSSDEQHWYAEVLIPWDIAPMAKTANVSRNLGLQLERHIASLQKTYANQPTSGNRQRFLSEIKSFQISDHAGDSLQTFVSVTARNDRITSDSEADASIDIFYKPDSSKQLSLTLNPDFGHVDSDNLVVNFSPTETFFSENRAFFTENQSLFTLNGQESLRLIHTRRIGAKPDGGDALGADIKGALKFTSVDDQISYGVFSAIEDDSDQASGRNFFAGRMMRKTERYNLGYLATLTERDTLNRQAVVQAVDYGYFINDNVSVSGQYIHSSIDEQHQKSQGSGGFVSVSYQPSNQWRHFLSGTYFDEDLQVNDLGFLPRNNIRSLAYQNIYNQYEFSQESLFQEHKIVTDVIYKENQQGVKLVSSLALTDIWKLKDASWFQWQVSLKDSAFDDLITRGNHAVALKQGKALDLMYFGKNTGKLRYHLHATLYDLPVKGQGYTMHAHPSYYFSDDYALTLGLWYTQSDDWLLWQQGNELNGYHRKEFQTNINFNAIIDEKQEFTLKFQWIGLSAKGDNSYQVNANGELALLNGDVNDFSISDTAIQLRYRYEIAPLSNVYLVYSRGGRALIDNNESLNALFSPGWDKRDGDSISMKVRYQF
ncbi:DUF5916 domain-containing protein [Thalassotalea ganghwensis]